MNPATEAIASNRDAFAFIWPEMILILGIVGLFLEDLFVRRLGEKQRTVMAWSAFAVTAAATLALLFGPGAEPASLFNGLLVNDAFAWFFRLFALAVTLTVIPLVPGSREVATARIGEFYALLLSITLGLMLLPASTDLVMIFLALELVSLVSYVLTGYRRGVRISAEGALKYVIYGGVASGTMLYGFSLLYGLAGSTTLVGLHTGLAAALAGSGATAAKVALAAATVFVLVGFGYKIAAAPFHMWTPDAYEGAPTPFTAFLSVGPKAAGLALMIRFFFGVFTTANPAQWAHGVVHSATDLPWPEILGILAIATMTVGNLTALTQTNVKRMLAFSSIAHAGYMLMGLAAASTAGLQAILLYAVIYLFMNLGAFAIVTAVGVRLGSDEISDYRGLSRRAPFAATLLAVFLFSLTGLPPLAGFIGKFYLFYAVILKGGTFMWILALVGALNGAVSLYYYAGVVKAMFLEKPLETTPLKLGFAFNAVAFVLVVPTFVLGVWWTPVADASKAALEHPPLLAAQMLPQKHQPIHAAAPAPAPTEGAVADAAR